MRNAGIRSKTKKKFRVTTDSRHDRPLAENVLNREFHSPTEPNEARLSDITYIRTNQGWMHLAVVLDLFTRTVVGWLVDSSMTSQLVVDTMQQAIDRDRLAGNVLCHSNGGSQYAIPEITKREWLCVQHEPQRELLRQRVNGIVL